jgi:hypothetical protein
MRHLRGSVHGAAPAALPRPWAQFAKDMPVGTDHAPMTMAKFL